MSAAPDLNRLWALSPEQLGDALRQVYAEIARLEALKLALIAQADHSGLATHDAATDLVAWLRQHVLLAPVEGKRQIKLAHLLEDHSPVQAALAAGVVPAASAAVVAETLEKLPSDADAELRLDAQTQLIELAKTWDTYSLRRLARRIDEVADPEGAERREADALSRAEAKAERETWCHLTFDEVNAKTHGRFEVDLATGRKLQRMLESLMNPARPDAIPFEDVDGTRISADERRGQALTELIDRIPLQDLPRTGGCDPVVIVTMTLETLTGGSKAAILDTGDRISPALARKLAAQAGVIPAVLGTSSEVLDLGRKARLFTKRQRIAMSVQQGGVCAVESCGRPAAWGDAHHLQQWKSDGKTDLTNGVIICKRHHTLADHPDYRVERLTPGRIRVNRRR